MRKSRTEFDIQIKTTQFKGKLGLVQMGLATVLIIMIIFMALPGYLVGKWTWSDLPKVPGINRVKSLESFGLEIPGWQSIAQKHLKIGIHQWSVQILEKENQPQVQLFLLPQSYYRSTPEVEWVDLDGVERWEKDSIEELEFTTTAGKLIKARFFKAWNKKTSAVVQWYAYPGGGSYQTFSWFWQDELAQIRGSRSPWVAVSLKINMNPLDLLESKKALSQELAQSIQNTLDTEVFRSSGR